MAAAEGSPASSWVDLRDALSRVLVFTTLANDGAPTCSSFCLLTCCFCCCSKLSWKSFCCCTACAFAVSESTAAAFLLSAMACPGVATAPLRGGKPMPPCPCSSTSASMVFGALSPPAPAPAAPALAPPPGTAASTAATAAALALAFGFGVAVFTAALTNSATLSRSCFTAVLAICACSEATACFHGDGGAGQKSSTTRRLE
mmetsp:Transcript_31346/g.63609  ORF Transcript_31346/g.63609 Transcript_31346/m.63609 type:complete len:202 (+) Transcript_31346:1341-1946(+)